METGPLAVWLWHSLRQAEVPIACLHARHVKAALSIQVNKTDANVESVSGKQRESLNKEFQKF